MKRVCNFGPGPAALPLEVLQQASDEFFDLAGTGKSVIETSHRSPEYEQIHNGVVSRCKELLGVGDEHTVLLLGGGASLQFVMVPLNLRRDAETADYLVTGSWSKNAVKEAKVLPGKTHVAADMLRDGTYARIPGADECRFSERPVYVHLTSNNTIAGTQYKTYPVAPAPLVADMSSDFLTRPIDVKPFGLIYAGAQKNVGPAGVAIVIIRNDLLERCHKDIPAMLSYAVHAQQNSLYNTPPCFSIYLTGKMLEWITRNGGVQGMAQRNERKALAIYTIIDQHPDFYRCPVERDSRSLMNVVFRLPSEDLEKRFVKQAEQAGMIGLKGHRSVGGIRASLYNGVEPGWVETLASFMGEFARTQG